MYVAEHGGIWLPELSAFLDSALDRPAIPTTALNYIYEWLAVFKNNWATKSEYYLPYEENRSKLYRWKRPGLVLAAELVIKRYIMDIWQEWIEGIWRDWLGLSRQRSWDLAPFRVLKVIRELDSILHWSGINRTEAKKSGGLDWTSPWGTVSAWHLPYPIPLRCDSQGSIALTKKSRITSAYQTHWHTLSLYSWKGGRRYASDGLCTVHRSRSFRND